VARRSMLWLLAVVLIACLSVSQAGTDTNSYKQARELALILRTIQQEYYKEVPVEELFRSAFRGMTEALDPYSQYLDAETYKNFRSDTTGEFGGLGIEIAIHEGILTVVAPIAGTPAWDAGILPGDRIMKINGVSTERIRLFDAMKMLRGQPGTEVTLTIRHAGSEVDKNVTIKRAIIQPPTVTASMVNEEAKIGHIRVHSFTARVLDEFDAAYKKLQDAGCRALILDLRDNPGGILQAAVGLANRFLSKGVIVSVRGRRESKTFEADEASTTCRLPLIVLINNGSASAAEIVAAAIKENRRGLIVGEPSFGKGSVQNVIPLNEDGSEALKLTTAQYHTPAGHMIDRQNGLVVTPDVEIQMTAEQLLALRLQAREDKMRAMGNGRPPDAAAPGKPPTEESKAKPEERPSADEAGKTEPPFKRRARVRDLQLDGAIAILTAQLQAASGVAAK